LWPPGRGQFWPQGHNLNNFGRGPLDDAIIPNMKALGLAVSDKKIFENCILKTYYLTPWPTYATNQNHLNNFGRGPRSDHFCEVWSKSNEWFQRRRCLSKNVYARRTTTDDGQRPVTIAHPEHFVLRWAKNTNNLSKTHLLCARYIVLLSAFAFVLLLP